MSFASGAASCSGVLESVPLASAWGAPLSEFTGEEAGLLGAHAFFDSDPLADHVGFVINVDVRGSGGRPFMFQTGDKPAGAVALFARETPMPRALSAAAMFFKLAPNDTDFTPALAAEALYSFVDRTAEQRGARVWQLTDSRFATASVTAGLRIDFTNTAGSAAMSGDRSKE